jgi:hypothetical protein
VACHDGVLGILFSEMDFFLKISGILKKYDFSSFTLGGLGYRSSVDILHEAYVASTQDSRFASAAYGNRFSIQTIAPFLLEDVLSPETSPLPSLMAINSSWEIICKRHPRMIALSKAATMGVLRPPVQDPEDNDTHNWDRILQAQESLFHTRFKNQAVLVLGAPTHDPRHLMETGYRRYHWTCSLSIPR